MKQYLKLQALLLRNYERMGRLVALGCSVILTLLVILLTSVEIGHVIRLLIASAAMIAIVYVARRIPWRKLRIRRSQAAVEPEITTAAEAPPAFYSLQELSPITIKYSGLSEHELKKVLYDEHHKWVVTLAMIVNPFWSRDHDIQPRVTNTFVVAQSGFGNKVLMGTIRRLTRVMQILYAFLIAALIIGVILRVMNVSLGGFDISDLFIAVGMIGLVFVTFVWSWYMSGVARGCRLVITEWNIILLVHQLPWRDSTRLVLQYGLYASSDPQQSLTGKLLRYTDLSISTTDPEEPLPGWIKACEPKKLKAVMAYWDLRKRNEQQRKYEEVARLGRSAGLDDTQEFPAMHH